MTSRYRKSFLSGHHGNIEKWRRQQSFEADLLREGRNCWNRRKYRRLLTKKDREYLSELENPDDTL